MAVHGGMLRVETAGDGQLVDLTEGVRSVVRTSGVERGAALVFAVGEAVGVTTMEPEPAGEEQLAALLERLAASARVRAALVGPSEHVPIAGGELLLDSRQQLVLLDFDTRARTREVVVQIVS